MPGESSNWAFYSPFVRDRVVHRAEGPSLDKKREHYYLDRGMEDYDGHPVDACKKQREFLKDIIALANTARWQNECAFLCLGIAEYDDWTVVGVEGKHPKRNPSPPWEKVRAHADSMNKWIEGIQRVYLDFARQYIQPTLPEIHYETGWIDDHLVGLLVIRPLVSPMGFHLTEDRRKQARLQALRLQPGWSWRRLGALTEPIEPHKRWMLKSHDEYPYIPLKGWRAYLAQLATLYDYRPEDPNEPDLYQPLRGRWDGNPVDDVARFLDRFAHSSTPPNVLLLTGAPGCGKTTLLEHLTRDLAEEAQAAIESTHGVAYVPGQVRALDFPKGAPVPVLIGLWGVGDSRQDTPEALLCRAMSDVAGDILGLDQHNSPANLLKDRDLNFVVMLDGLDEISRLSKQRWQRTLHVIVGFIKDHPHARFVVTCRSDRLEDIGPEWGAYPRLQVEPMLPAQVRQYLGGTTWASLLDRSDILTSTLQLLCNPRRINALCETDVSRQNLGIVLENAVEGFVAEEHKKYVLSQEDRARLKRQVDKFAFWLLEQGQRTIGEEVAREFLRTHFGWLYRSGLLIARDGSCGFVEPIVHDYFVARRLLELCRSHRLEPAIHAIAMHQALWQRAIQIAANTWQEDLTVEPMASLVAQLQPENRLQVIAERRFSAIGDVTIVKVTLGEYLQRKDASSTLVEQLLRDLNPSTQRAAVEAVATAHYLPAADALYHLGSRAGDELRDLVALVLIGLGDPRGGELQQSTDEVEEMAEGQPEDTYIGLDELMVGALAQMGG